MENQSLRHETKGHNIFYADVKNRGKYHLKFLE